MKEVSSDRINSLIYRWKVLGDDEARDIIIEENEPLVRSIIKRFTGRLDYEDLYQLGMIGLIKAIDRFDRQRGVRFSTYAVPLIIGEIKTFLRDHTPVKFSRSIKEMGRKVKETEEDLTKYLNRCPSLKEVARELGITVEEVASVSQALQTPISLDKEPGCQEQDSGYNLLMKKVTSKELSKKNEADFNLSELLAGLDYKERSLIKQRFFEGESQKKVGEYFGLSQVQVSRWEKKVLRKIKESYMEDF